MLEQSSMLCGFQARHTHEIEQVLSLFRCRRFKQLFDSDDLDRLSKRDPEWLCP